MEKALLLKDEIEKANSICVFTGAGISCPSGIPDFRSADGLYNQEGRGKYMPEEIISHSFFVAHTEMFYEFYRTKMLYPEAKPNAAHLYFAGLEKSGKRVSVVTQNIDNLHTLAGSTNVMELHGSVYRNYCTECHTFYGIDAITSANTVPKCKCGGTIKPDVVLYEESLDNDTVVKAVNAIESADLIIVVGTSLTVYPAASFIRYRKSGSVLALVNKSKTDYDDVADITINDDIIRVVEKLKAIPHRDCARIARSDFSSDCTN